jgi:hypothetical protein
VITLLTSIVGLIFWILIIGSGVLFIVGMWKKSWKAMLCSGIIFLPTALYFGGAENWIQAIALFPVIPFAMSYYYFRKKGPSNIAK